MIEAVLFDLDNTLIDRDAAFRDCLCAEFGDSRACEDLCHLDERGQGDRETLLEAWQRYGGTPLTLTELGCRIAARLQPDPALLASLERLGSKFKVGIVTNGSSRSQREKIQAAGLGQVFGGACWVSDEVGVRKPDPAIFLTAANGLNVAPGHCLFLGDYWPHDGVGAQAAGMRARMVDRVMTAARLADLIEEEGLQWE